MAMTEEMPDRRPVRLVAVVVAVAGLTAGIALWYALEQTVGQPGVGLAFGALLIYASARACAALALRQRLPRDAPAALATAVAVGVPFVVLMAIGLPPLASLAGGLVVAGVGASGVAAYRAPGRDGRARLGPG